MPSLATSPEVPIVSISTLHDSLDETVQSQVLKWILPMCYAMFGFYIQSVCLHFATYSYIHKYVVDAEIPPDHNPYATLADPVQDALGETPMSIHWLDAVAAAFPAAFFALTVFFGFHKFGTNRRTRSMRASMLQLWTKVMLCAGFLFITKGVIGAVTTVPDSGGWNVCKDRLKPEGVKWMKEEHSFWSMMAVDFEWNVLWYHHPLRYCSDMMYSGHTFVVTLFALGLYELTRVVRPTANSKNATIAKMVCLTGLTIVTIGQQMLEIYAVEKSRFHYTSDIVVALIMTFLFYTNGAIAVAAKLWSKRGINIFLSLRAKINFLKYKGEGDAWNKLEDISEETVSPDTTAEKAFRPEWNVLVSGGDIFIPPCCVPCCCLAGREHIYSDQKIKDILDQYVVGHSEALRPPLQEYLKREMNLNEGVSMHDFVRALRSKANLDAQVSGHYVRAP